MRKPNVEIKRVNLAKAEIQAQAYFAQAEALETKANEVRLKLETKLKAIEVLKAEIAALTTNIVE